MLKREAGFITEIYTETRFKTEVKSSFSFITELAVIAILPGIFGSSSLWILVTGDWNDGGVYDDFNVWID